MKKVLLTGASGFVGRNILAFLEKHYEVKAPKRQELNVVDEHSVDNYLKDNKFDIVVHCANISPLNNPADRSENILEYTLRAFLNIAKYSGDFEKIIYTGSGAEYDKRFDIKMAKEEDIGKHIPADHYGYAKYILNTIARNSENIYNLKLFGCYGPTDAKTKFIRDAIDCCLENKAVSVRQNCFFEYLYVGDLAEIIHWFIENKPKYHDYNMSTNTPTDLVTIAQMVADKMGNRKKIEIAKEGLNKEYTASNQRLVSELKNFRFTTLSEGIDKQIAWQADKGYFK
ncbi:MAG: NAD(P)-dependent oxidoreductase [Endomicrobium sp.]|jgi:GDP-L-fucose synthase|nr:NAD(P)-dependent oxidoreductase [Endomicrobium sp.]